MSTLMNYMYQSFNFRGREKLKPYYHLIANIATEEIGHIELVAHTINLLMTGATKDGAPETAPLAAAKNWRNTHHAIATGQTALVGNSMGGHWTGDYVFSSGNLVLDLLHNFFLENGARTQKIRVYEMTDHPVARQMLGYLLVRGGVHALAYAKALESITGVDVSKMLPIPNIKNSDFPEARAFASCTASASTTTRKSPRSGAGPTRMMAAPSRWSTARRRAARCRTCRKCRRSSHPVSARRNWPRSPSASWRTPRRLSIHIRRPSTGPASVSPGRLRLRCRSRARQQPRADLPAPSLPRPWRGPTRLRPRRGPHFLPVLTA